ncbi:hypothetical protein [Streptomyces chartreusis]
MKEVANLIAEWQNARAQLAAIERAEHPDVVDRHGRTWTWVSKDLYRHCGNAAPADMINDFGLPSQKVLDNPNYGELCEICLNGRQRHVPDCKPEWNCSHAMHQREGES